QNDRGQRARGPTPRCQPEGVLSHSQVFCRHPRGAKAVSSPADDIINLDHLNTCCAADKDRSVRERSFYVVPLEFKIELKSRLAVAHLLDMVAINSRKRVAVESEAIRFRSGCEINFDKFGGHLCIDG